MKILVFAHKLGISGTTVNAIELTAALRDLHGCEVAIFATPGPMVPLLAAKRLKFFPAPEPGFHPSLARMRALREVVLREKPDCIHAWDWFQCVDAYYGVHLPWRVPLVITDMCMGLQRLLPKALPTTFGTPALVDQARAAGRKPVELLLPPVDVGENTPGVVDTKSFRDQCGITARHITVVTVSRLDSCMKGESLQRTIDAVRTLGHSLPLRFVIVGDGTGRAAMEELAARTNSDLGRSAVVLTGPMIDPRVAYASADIVVGMGSSALRGMAFGKPVIVVGEKGFSAPFTPETAEDFYYHGMYGLAEGDPDNRVLVGHLKKAAEDPDNLRVLGDFSRQFVVKHFALNHVSSRLHAFCAETLAAKSRPYRAAFDGLRTAAIWLKERRFLSARRAVRSPSSRLAEVST